MPWLSIPYKNSDLRLQLKNFFSIQNPFSLIILTLDQKVVTTNGIEIIKKAGGQCMDL